MLSASKCKNVTRGCVDAEPCANFFIPLSLCETGTLRCTAVVVALLTPVHVVCCTQENYFAFFNTNPNPYPGSFRWVLRRRESAGVGHGAIAGKL